MRIEQIVKFRTEIEAAEIRYNDKFGMPSVFQAKFKF